MANENNLNHNATLANTIKLITIFELLKDKGIITESEYTAKRKEVMERHNVIEV